MELNQGGTPSEQLVELPRGSSKYEPTEAQILEIRNRFNAHAMNPQQTERSNELRRDCYVLATRIVHLVGPGRDQALALTKLEECLFHLNAAIAREIPKQ